MSIFSSRADLAQTHWAREIGLLLLINTLIALLLTVLDGRDSLACNLLISHCIGFSIGLLNALFCRGRPDWGWSWRTPIVIPLGILLGFKVAHWLGAPDVLSLMINNPETQWRWIATALIVSFSACAFFVVFYHSLAYKNALEIEKRQHAEARQAEASAQLAMLQAQIEPHFLFNTLANVHSLIARDAALAQTLLEHLNDYLRASLSRTRQAKTSLADEVDLVRALLSISQIRLGERLKYRFDISASLMQAQLPPLLLQPLVENAIEHGIEPAIDGGSILIEAGSEDSPAGKVLILRVTDSGQGLQNTGSDGLGLANVRARLASLYGDEGRLALYPNQPHGVIAELRLPLRTIEPNNEPSV
ncbi:sensor histidine kinase [Chitinibacter sp. S2-10]|uniref:sensor histidine kinase n=1 Tax=Chitinibacter sp. S2-10 TaxID=3373597 RepID=UPI003977CA6B